MRKEYPLMCNLASVIVNSDGYEENDVDTRGAICAGRYVSAGGGVGDGAFRSSI